jgi:hypothetical protein
MNEYGALVECTDRTEPKGSERIPSQRQYVHQKRHNDWPSIELDFLGESGKQ